MAQENKRNLLTEKYARMMKYTLHWSMLILNTDFHL
ncbi:MAG TPA: hypothetical protein DEF89_01050 [Desulfosporosinus sp.]|nr:hypothetical protein [Desulfosporosinus sp.]